MKLVSKNPVQRFKQGKKIQKFDRGGTPWAGYYTVGNWPKLSSNTKPSYKHSRQKQAEYNRWIRNNTVPDVINKEFVWRYPTYTSYALNQGDFDDWDGRSALVMDMNSLSDQNHFAARDLTDFIENNIHEQAMRTPSRVIPYKNATQRQNFTAQLASLKPNSTPQSGTKPNTSVKQTKNQQPTNNRSTRLTSQNNQKNRKFLNKGIEQGWKGTAGIIDDESIAALQELGINTKNALEAQKALNIAANKAGINLGSIAEDNKWGKQSKLALNHLLGLKKADNQTQMLNRDTNTPFTESEIPTVEFVQQQLPQTIKIPVGVNTAYNKSSTRDLINKITGRNAYNFTGSQRRALRQWLNGENYDENGLVPFNLTQFVNYRKLKQGGRLVSKNPIKKFQTHFFSKVAQ